MGTEQPALLAAAAEALPLLHRVKVLLIRALLQLAE
jgi:hypothetical protein